jgi:hypothetical protein
MKTQPTAREQLDRISTLVRRSFSYWKRALLVFVAIMAVAVPYVFTRPRAYKSETVILYQETIRSSDVAGGEGSGENARRVGARLREVLLSRASLEPIIKDLHLFAKPGQTLDRGELIEAVDDMRKNITFRAREGDTFEIAFVGPTPKEAQEVTRRLGDCIVQEAVSRRAEHAKTLKEFLDAEAERNKTDLKQKEAEFAKFVTLHPALAARLQGQVQGGSAPAAGGRPTSGDPVLASLEARAAQIDRQLRGGKPAPSKPTATFVPPPDSPELVAARKDLADKLARFTDKHPDVIAARNRLKAAEAQQADTNEVAAMAFATQQAKLAHEQRLEEAPRTPADEASLRRELADVQNQIFQRKQLKVAGDAGAMPDLAFEPAGSEVALAVEFRRLQREVDEGRERQRQLDERLFKASITASSVMNDRNIQVSILDPAFLPIAPVSKSRTMLLAGLLALAIILSVVTALFSARVDDRVYDRMDIERLDTLPVLGVIPRATPALPPKRI